MNTLRNSIIVGIQKLIENNPVLQSNVRFVQKMLNQPIDTKELFSPYAMFNTADNKEVSLTFFVDDQDNEYLNLQILKSDDELTTSEIVGLWYWPKEQMQIACYRFIELVECDGVPTGPYPEALTHNEITGEAIVIHQELDQDEDEDNEYFSTETA